MALRFDTYRVDKIDRLPNGGLRVPAVLTRTGVFEYRDTAGQTVREYRPPEEVFHADSIASLRDAAVTIGHPRAGVTPENWAGLSVGHVSGNPAKDDSVQGLAADVVIARADAVGKIDRRELADISGGYEVEIDPTSGVTPAGERYDVIQRKIRYNHVALLKRGDGRQGTQVGLRLDSRGDQTCADHETCHDGARTMKLTLRHDGKDTEVEAGSAEHLALQTRIDAAKDAEIATLKTAVADRDAKLAEVKVREDAAAALAKAEARKALETAAIKMIPEFKADGKSDRDVMIAVIAKADPTFDPAGREDAYLAARFDMSLTPVAPPVAPATQTLAQAHVLPGTPRVDEAAPTIESNPVMYAEALAKSAENAWRNPAPRN